MKALPPEITTSRAALDELDHALLQLVAKRRAIVASLFEQKRALGLPLFDEAREEALLAERRAFAETIGVPGDVSEGLFRVMLGDSHTRMKG